MPKILRGDTCPHLPRNTITAQRFNMTFRLGFQLGFYNFKPSATQSTYYNTSAVNLSRAIWHVSLKFLAQNGLGAGVRLVCRYAGKREVRFTGFGFYKYELKEGRNNDTVVNSSSVILSVFVLENGDALCNSYPCHATTTSPATEI
jgi:hypothetical protein